MAKLLSLRRLFEEVEEEVASRVSSAPLARVKLELVVGGEGVKLSIGEGEFEVAEGEVDARVEMPPSAFNALLFGMRTPLEALMESRVECSVSLRDVLEALEALFAPRAFHVWPPDYW